MHKLPPGTFNISDPTFKGNPFLLELTRKDGERISVLGESKYGLKVLAHKLINTSALKRHRKRP